MAARITVDAVIGHIHMGRYHLVGPALQGGAVDANDQDGDGPGGTVLHMAAYKGHAPTIAMALQAGANPNARDRYGETPLWCLARRGEVR
jgi:ankyrin repeat protein